jgi:two-component system CheB/CheR fusion protein
MVARVGGDSDPIPTRDGTDTLGTAMVARVGGDSDPIPTRDGTDTLGTAMVARVGGDEFVVVQDAPEPLGAATMAAWADRLHGLLTEPFAVRGLELPLLARVGAAAAHAPVSAADLLRRGDLALARARRLGLLTALFTGELERQGRRRLHLAAGLRAALTDGRLELHYQPVHRLAEGAIAGYEALLRWRADDGPLVAPGEFLPLAESSGLIEPIGEWVVDEAARQLRAWHEAGARQLFVALNLAPRELRRRGMVDLVAAALERHRLPPGAVIVEVTEGALRSELQIVQRTLAGLSELGVQVAIDDFGADWSSLSRLGDLPVRVVKLDRAFLRRVPDDARALRLFEAVVGLARALGLTTTAEGIETPAQLRSVRAAGCAQGQGFLLGRPRPAGEVELPVEG